jgi:hypothetical protein
MSHLSPTNVVALCLLAAGCSPPVVHVRAEPTTARIVRGTTLADSATLGIGSADVPLPKNLSIPIFVIADGYAYERRTLTAADATAKVVIISLRTRVVMVTALPTNAKLTVDGVVQPQTSINVGVPEGKQVHVEVTSPGYRSVSRTYTNRPEAPAPPLREQLELTERAVLVTALPSGASVYSNGKLVGDNGAGDVIVPRNGCASARVEAPGYAPIEKQYCWRDGVADPKPIDQIVLKDRLVKVVATPPEAEIYSDGRRRASGEADIIVASGECVTLLIKAAAFLPDHRSLCNQTNAPPLHERESIHLDNDDSWGLTFQSDQANRDFTIEVGTKRTPDEAWKIIAQIVTNQFDVLEVTDKETGYMRTGWNIRKANRWVYRTRMIVKLADSNPLKYTVKLVSEQAYDIEKLSDDEKFEPRDRILLQYKDLINELQARLR